MTTEYTPMELKAARALNDKCSKEIGFDPDDMWLRCAEEFKEDARAALNACHAPDLLAALQDAYEILGISYPLTEPDSDKRGVVLSKARAALLKAKGESND